MAESKDSPGPEFWKKLTVGVVTSADPKTVLASTIDLCRHLLVRENPNLFVEKAVKLAAQFRHPRDDSSKRLLVDSTKLQEIFTIDAEVQFDIQDVSLWDSKVSMIPGTESFEVYYWSQCLRDESLNIEDDSTSWFSGLFSEKTKEALTICSEDFLDSPLRLCFCDKPLYKKKDQTWLEDFMSSVYRLSETQALIFGPAFAYLILMLRIMEFSDISRAMSDLFNGMNRSAKIADFKVNMPPNKELFNLLQFVQPALKELPQVYFNTVIGGLLLRLQKDCIFLRKNFLGLNLDNLLHPQLELLSILDVFSILLQDFGSVMRNTYFTFIEQNFPESLRAYCHARQKYFSDEVFEVNPLWEFARLFSDTVFDELTFDCNHQVCTIGAVILDLWICPDRVENWPVLGPRYNKLVSNKPQFMRIDLGDAILAENMVKAVRGVNRITSDADSLVDGEESEKDQISTKLSAKPYTVMVESRDENMDYFLVVDKVHAANGLRHLKRVDVNCLKAEFDNVHQAFDFLVMNVNTIRIVPCRVGIIRDIPVRIPDEDLKKALQSSSEYEIVSVRRLECAGSRKSISLSSVKLEFRGIELPSCVVYSKLCIPVEPILPKEQ